MDNQIEPCGYYKAGLWGAAGSPEIIVYSDGERYYSFDSVNPETPLDPNEFLVNPVPLLTNHDVLTDALIKAREFIVATANEYKQQGSLSICNSLKGGELVSELDAILKDKEEE